MRRRSSAHTSGDKPGSDRVSMSAHPWNVAFAPLRLCVRLSSSRVRLRCWVTAAPEGCDRKYDSDSSDVVRSTVLTFTPRREINEAGAKFSTALMPADVI